MSVLGNRVLDSPPRVRGAPGPDPRIRRTDRLTPACAGSTRRVRRRCHRRTTHPRVCGEHTSSHFSRAFCLDSPPRVRGALTQQRRVAAAGRLTPACAGSTPSSRRARASPTTHPRVCGEHGHPVDDSEICTDSPPRVRGAPKCACGDNWVRRLTPACAGSTTRASRTAASSSTHPRVCGEHLFDGAIVIFLTDSPPRVRGAHLSCCRSLGSGRLTPACAGSTDPVPGARRPETTHPRVCGEHVLDVFHLPSFIDSPPRVRGAPPGGLQGPDMIGLTPACAGSTTRRRHRTRP